MSLALFKDRIDAGEIDEKVRAHLRGCDECRAYYDQLARVRRALGDDGAAAERERLLAALPAEQPRQAGLPSWLLPIAAMLALGVTAYFAAQRPRPVELRGGDEQSVPLSVRVYGKAAPGEKVHLVAEFPGSREAHVPMRAELQYFTGAREAIVVETRSQLKTITFHSTPGADLVPVGEAFPVGQLGPGEATVCAWLEKAPVPKYCSTLVVAP